MNGLEEEVQLEREDGVKLPGLRVTPDMDAAASCNGAGIVVLAGERGLEPTVHDKLVAPLSDLGYFVIATDIVRGRLAESDDAARARAAGLDHAIAIDDLEAAILKLKQVASGKIAVVGTGLAGAIAIEAATMLPQIDAVVAIDAPPPASSARLARVRAPIAVVRPEDSTLFPAKASRDLYDRTRRAKANVLPIESATAQDGFFLHPRDDSEASEARIAWDQVRDFLAGALT